MLPYSSNSQVIFEGFVFRDIASLKFYLDAT